MNILKKLLSYLKKRASAKWAWEMDIFKLGRRKIDAFFMITWEKKRLVLIADVDWVPGAVCLEPREFMQRDLSAPRRLGVVLFCTGWNNKYIVGQRGGFTDDDYFELAERLFKEKGIKVP